MATTTTTVTPTVQQLFHSLLADGVADVEGAAKSLLTTFFTNVAKNPTATNFIAQGAILMASAPLQLPALENETVAQFASVGQQLTALLPNGPTS